MKTAIELIADERNEQIEKHGYTVDADRRYTDSELIRAALYCIDQKVFGWPVFWETGSMHKIAKNDRVAQLVKAASFIAAEIDRIKATEDKQANQ